MFIGDQRYIEQFLRDFLQYYGLKAERKKIEVEADRPNYVIGVTVAPLPQELQVKGDLEVEDFSESSEESEEEEDSEQSIELMPTNKPKQVSRGDTGASRPGTGQSGVEGFQGKKAEMGRDVFLDDLNNGKKTGIEYDPFSYAPVKNARPATNDLNKVVPRPGTNNPNSRPVTNDFNNQTNNSRPQSNDLMKSSQMNIRPTSNDFNKQMNNSKLQNNDFNLPNNQRPTTNDFNKPPNQRPTSMDANLRPNSNDGLKPVSRPLSKDTAVNVSSFANPNMNSSFRNPVIEVRPKSKDHKESGGAKLELVENRPMSKDIANKDKMMGDNWFIKPPKQEIRPNSKDMFTLPKGNNKMDMSMSIDLFDKGNKIEPMKIDNFSVDEGNNNNSVMQKSGFRLN